VNQTSFQNQLNPQALEICFSCQNLHPMGREDRETASVIAAPGGLETGPATMDHHRQALENRETYWPQTDLDRLVLARLETVHPRWENFAAPEIFRRRPEGLGDQKICLCQKTDC